MHTLARGMSQNAHHSIINEIVTPNPENESHIRIIVGSGQADPRLRDPHALLQRTFAEGLGLLTYCMHITSSYELLLCILLASK